MWCPYKYAPDVRRCWEKPQAFLQLCPGSPVIRLLSIAPQMHEISLISTVRTDSACFRGVAARQHALATLKPFHFPADFHVIDICCFYATYKVRYSIAYIDFAQLSKRRSLHLWGARALWSVNMQPSRAQFFIGGVVGQRRFVVIGCGGRSAFVGNGRTLSASVKTSVLAPLVARAHHGAAARLMSCRRRAPRR